MREEARKVQLIEQEKRKTGDVVNSYSGVDYLRFDEASRGFSVSIHCELC